MLRLSTTKVPSSTFVLTFVVMALSCGEEQASPESTFRPTSDDSSGTVQLPKENAQPATPAAPAGTETPSATAPPVAPAVEVDWPATLASVFPQDRVVNVELKLADGDWDALMSDWFTNQEKNYYPAELRFDAEQFDSVGVRIKGFSSLSGGSGEGGGRLRRGDGDGKFPLKINFDKFGGPRFLGIDRLNLSNNWADISLMRERLASRMFTAMGVPVAQTAYVRATVAGIYRGLYTQVEQVDKRFLKRHFGTTDHADDGNLYKSVFINGNSGSLEWQGDSKADYTSTTDCPAEFQECGLLLKTNEEDPALNDYADLLSFLQMLNQSSDADFEATIENHFDVDMFLRFAAVSVAISNFDSYLGMAHNFYLYHRPDTDRFVMIPWDLNESYAGHPCARDAVDFDVRTPVCQQRGQNFVLAERIFAVPRFMELYLGYLQEIADDWLTEAQHQLWIDEFRALVADQVPTDPNYITTTSAWETSLGDALPDLVNRGGHGGVEYNLLDFVRRRRASIVAQLAQ